MVRPRRGDECRTETIKFFVDKVTLTAIEAECRREERSKAEFCRHAVMKYLKDKHDVENGMAPEGMLEKFIAVNLNADSVFGKAIRQAVKKQKVK